MHNGDGLEDKKLKLVHTYVNPSFSSYFFFFCLGLVCLLMGWGVKLPGTHRWCLRPGCVSGSCERWAGSPGDYHHDDNDN